jgi:hypothetical protein
MAAPKATRVLGSRVKGLKRIEFIESDGIIKFYGE